MQKILVIEDDVSFRKAVSRILSQNGFEIIEASTGKTGLLSASQEKPDLVVLDLILPGIKGTEVCLELKQKPQTAGIPILILTGNDREGQDIACLDIGADDYLTKPVKTERLLAHCKALLRRFTPDTASQNALASIGPLELDYSRKLVILDGKEYPQLTPKEFGLLYELALNNPKPIDRTSLYRQVWGMEPPSEGSLKTIDVHVRRIRLKLGWKQDQWLTFLHGRGYCLKAPPKS